MPGWLKESFTQKAIAIGILVVALFLLRHVLNLILLTFLFTYLFYTLHSFVIKKTKIPSKLLLVSLYAIFISIIGVLGFTYAPVIIQQLGEVLSEITTFKFTDYKDTIPPKIYELIIQVDMGEHLRSLGDHTISSIANISGFLIQLIIALILSFFFILEKDKVKNFLKRFERSKVGFLYNYYKEFGKNFLNTFGKVLQVQLIIATANAILSFIGLLILGFPHLLGLTIMIFFLGLIPVAGVIISLVPLSIIAFQIGGFVKVIHVIIMIIVVHAVENYFLNPKLYSMRMKLPIFFTFSVLIVSEDLMGIWGLLLGMPLFMFMLNLMGVDKQKKDLETNKKE